MNKTQRLRKQREALTQTFPRRNVPAAQRSPGNADVLSCRASAGAAVLGTTAGPCPAVG